MGFNCGIVGLPNVGKSTLFNALTRAGIEAANYPFATIEANVGIVPVPDPRLERIAEIVRPKEVVPTTIEFVDIAGLVRGAARGEGLGNRFLASIRETDAIAHVVRCFEDPNVVHVSGSVDPARDIEVIGTELALADLETVERALEKAAKAAKAQDKAAVARKRLLERVRAHLDGGEPVRTLGLSGDEARSLRDLNLLTAKPIMYVCNVAEDGFADNPLLARIAALARAEGAEMVPVCAAIEAEIIELDPRDREMFLAEMGFEEPGLNRVIRAGYRLLGLRTFFTAGPKEVRAWTVPAGATAPEAAGRIHSDFQRGFIRAEVVSYDDFIECGGEQGAREAGKLRSEGKGYVVQEGDVIHFRFNV